MAPSLFSAYASLSTSLTLIQQAYYQFIPTPLRHQIAALLHRVLHRRSPNFFTLIVEEYHGLSLNPLFHFLQLYLCNKITSKSSSIVKATIENNDVNAPVSLHLARQESFKEVFNGFEVHWVFRCNDLPVFRGLNKPKSRTSSNADDRMTENHMSPEENRFFELRFLKDHKEDFFSSYLPQVMEVATEIMNKDKVLKIWTLKYTTGYDRNAKWESVNLNHPSTFDSLALDPSVKQAIIEDLDRFLGRKEFYRKVGRAWKRGYLLHGPPGTGKSSMIAAIANYLKFDVYDLQLMHIEGDNMLRKMLLSTTNRSILVIEDIDCSMGLPKKRMPIGGDGEEEDDSDQSDDEKGTPITTCFNFDGRRGNMTKISLSGLLNFIDGLWSSCGDERIIIFTTNHKDRIDPALLRPGRMDMHIHMSYLSMSVFVKLASNYLGIPIECGLDHPLSKEIEGMIQTTNVTPAEVAEELMKGKDLDTAFEGVLEFLKRKRVEMEFEKQEKEKAKRIRKMKKEEKAKEKEEKTKEKVLNVIEALGKEGNWPISTGQLRSFHM